MRAVCLGALRAIAPFAAVLLGACTPLIAACTPAPAGGAGSPATSVAPSTSNPVNAHGSQLHIDPKRIATGLSHSCAIRRAGRVYCWGSNERGQLGTGDSRDRAAPSEVIGLRDAVQLGLGSWHSCALTARGQVWCWGESDNGQVGAGQRGKHMQPVRVPQLREVRQLVVSDNTNCALQRDGAALCWGSNFWKLTDGLFKDALLPVTLEVGPEVMEMALVRDHACILDAGGRVRCIGSRRLSQLGREQDGTVVADAQMLSGIEQLGLGERHGCARLKSGEVWCWGPGHDGELGNGARYERPRYSRLGRPMTRPTEPDGPQRVQGPADAVELAVGDDFSCIRRRDGSVACWGLNRSGQLGDGTTTARPTPVPVLGLSDVIELAAGAAHVCARTRDDSVWCWGYGDSGQLGNGLGLDPAPATKIAGITDATQLALGDTHSCLLHASGHVSCWGDNGLGQLGSGNYRARRSPVRVSGLSDAVEVVVGSAHSCARRRDGRVLCWGDKAWGQLGDGSPAAGRYYDRHGGGQIDPPDKISDVSHPLPQLVPAIRDATALYVANTYSCARDRSDMLTCWGGKDSTPKRDEASGAVRSWVHGGAHGCVLRHSGQVACEGANHSGRLGDGTTESRKGLVEVRHLGDAVQLAAGTLFTCALRRSGQVSCWGDNLGGMLGDGTHLDRSLPTGVLGLADAVHISCGDRHACAVRRDGRVSCWGSGFAGELGDGAVSSRAAPVDVVGLPPVTQVGAAKGFSCAIDRQRQVWCWGKSGLEGSKVRAPRNALRPVRVPSLPAP